MSQCIMRYPIACGPHIPCFAVHSSVQPWDTLLQGARKTSSRASKRKANRALLASEPQDSQDEGSDSEYDWEQDHEVGFEI
jgi:hypothetical protein